MPRVAILAALAALLLSASGGAASGSRILWQGPVLAGNALTWAEESGGKGSLHLWRQRGGERVVYSGDRLALGRPFAASRTFLAFERTYPSCPPPSGHVCPEGADSVIGPLGGPYRILARPRTCFLPTVGNAVALDGGVAAYLELDCVRQRLRVVVRDVGHDGWPHVVRAVPFSERCCRDIAIAGRYVAWGDGRHVVVYDWLTRRVAYRAPIGPVGVDVDFGFDVQRDGKLAVALRLVEFARAGPTTIAWLSRAAPRLHVLPFRGSDTRISIAGNRIGFARYVTAKSSALVVTDLAGHARTIARFAQPTRIRSFDFDGRQVAWASDRVTDRRVDCPPPGQGRPCVRRESGVTSILMRTLTTGANRVVARLRFVDAFGR